MVNKPRKLWMAGILSIIQPGLGHVYNGEIRKSVIIYLLPFLLLPLLMSLSGNGRKSLALRRRLHVHLFVSLPPQISVSKLVGRIKGQTSRKLLAENRRLSGQFWGRHLWGRGYFATSSGNVTDDVIMQYIAEQDLEERAHDDDFTLAP